MSTNLILRDDQQLEVVITAEAMSLKDMALETASLIAKVTTEQQQESAVAAQVEIKRVMKLVEDSRVAAKVPVLEFGRRIDQAAKTFCADLKAEEIRVATLVGDFQALELAKVRAAEASRLADLSEIERRTQEKLAQAKSHDEIDEIHQKANEEARALPVVAPVRAEQQRVREEWEIQIYDIWLLARQHPTCVEIKPRMSEIKSLIDSGVNLLGVSARKVVVSGVRLSREKEAIAV